MTRTPQKQACILAKHLGLTTSENFKMTRMNTVSPKRMMKKHPRKKLKKKGVQQFLDVSKQTTMKVYLKKQDVTVTLNVIKTESIEQEDLIAQDQEIIAEQAAEQALHASRPFTQRMDEVTMLKIFWAGYCASRDGSSSGSSPEPESDYSYPHQFKMDPSDDDYSYSFSLASGSDPE